MKSGKIIVFIATAVSMAFITACNNTRYLPKNESLYVGAKINVKAPELKKGQRKAIKTQLAALTRPKPNSSILGLRPKLWFWNIGGNPKKKFSVRKLIKNLGEPPVVLSDVNLDHNNKVLKNQMENTGYFNAEVSGEISNKKRRATAIYTVVPGPRYTINNVTFQADSSDLRKAILRTKRRSLLKTNAPFNLEIVKAERIRIDERLKNQGFYFHSPEHIIIDVDSTIGGHKIDMFLTTKPETPVEARKRQYVINTLKRCLSRLVLNRLRRRHSNMKKFLPENMARKEINSCTDLKIMGNAG